METSDYVAALRLDGGHLAADFVNTLGGSHAEGPHVEHEHLRSYADLLAWSLRVGTLSRAEAERLAATAATRPADSAAARSEAIRLRELSYSVLRPVAEVEAPPAAAVRQLLDAERDALAHARLEPGKGSFRWRWDDGGDLERPLWPLIHATVELLTEGPLDRLKLCGGCRWLFVDRSKNRSRRWCSMEECGTSAKMRRYTERRRRLANR